MNEDTYRIVLRHFSKSSLLDTQIDTRTADPTMLHGTTVKFKTSRLSYNTGPFQTFILRTAVAIKKKHVHVRLGTANINAYFHDTALRGCFVG
jgi:hypothetical protein